VPRRRSDDSQTLRALLEMREILVRGEFRGGERIREIPLAARLRVSRTPLRTVLGRLEQEGLVAARPTGGYVAAEFSVHDIRDGIEVRGALEGLAAKLAAERNPRPEELAGIRKCLAATDRLLQRWTSGTDSLARYIVLNATFHTQVVDLAKSAMVRRAIDRAVALPFASPNAFLIGHALKKEGHDIVALSQVHHRAIVDAIANHEPGRAESLAREHSRLARTSLELILNRRLLSSLPGASLIRFPDPAELDATRRA
jgi:GntR family transcriptional regulator of vanillate catabolism